MKQKEYLMLSVFGLFLILFAVFSVKIDFHDSVEYITIAKNFAGIKNVDIFTGHSLFYPLIISLFLIFSKTLLMIKLVNSLWLFLIGATLLLWLKNKKAFIIFTFSPLIWTVSLETAPVLPASFFFFLAFIFFKKQDIRFNRFYSGLLFGLSAAFYTPLLFVFLFFLLVYFWEIEFNKVAGYAFVFIIGLAPRLILDYCLFNMPFYSLLRYAGVQIIILLGLNPTMGRFDILTHLNIFLILIVISPFLFKLYKLNFKQYKKEIIFFMLVTFMILLGAPMLKYFLIIVPIIVLFLAKRLNEREIKWHCIISVFLILILTWNFFTTQQDVLIEQDLETIISEYDVKNIIAGPYEASLFATFLWQDAPKIIWFQDFQASLENRTEIRGYEFTAQSKIPLRDRIKISASFNRFSDETYEDYIIVTRKENNLEKFTLRKCYEVLCVYE